MGKTLKLDDVNPYIVDRPWGWYRTKGRALSAIPAALLDGLANSRLRIQHWPVSAASSLRTHGHIKALSRLKTSP
jgi:hypothetical protein